MCASQMIDDGYQLCEAALDRYEAKLGLADSGLEQPDIGTDEL
jgi:hypothetical protein